MFTELCKPAPLLPASPPESAVVIGSPFSTIKAKSATLSNKQRKQANLKQTSFTGFEMFPGVLSDPSS